MTSLRLLSVLALAVALATERFAYYLVRAVFGVTFLPASEDPEQFYGLYQTWTGMMAFTPLLGALLALVAGRWFLLAVGGLALSSVGFVLLGVGGLPVAPGALGLVTLGAACFRVPFYLAVAEQLEGASNALRLAAFVMLSLAIDVGAFFSPFGSEPLASIHPSAPFVAAAAITLLSMLFVGGALRLTRSLPKVEAAAAPGRALGASFALTLLALPGMMARNSITERALSLMASASDTLRVIAMSLNPVVVVLGGGALVGVLLALRGGRDRVQASTLMGAGSLLLALAWLPLMSVPTGGDVGLVPVAGLALSALGEVLLLPVGMAVVASTGPKRWRPVGLGFWLLATGAPVLSDASVGLAFPGLLLAATVVAGLVLLLRGPRMQQAFTGTEPAPSLGTGTRVGG